MKEGVQRLLMPSEQTAEDAHRLLRVLDAAPESFDNWGNIKVSTSFLESRE